MSPHHQPYSDEIRQAVIADDRSGMPRKDICAKYGISDWTLRSWAGKRIDRVNGTTERVRLRDQAKALHWDGHTYVNIAKQLGIPVSTAWDYVNNVYDERQEP